MKEVELQSLIVKAVQTCGGAAHKMSHRFMVGVVDLLIKLPHNPAAILEVKIDKFKPGILPTHKVKLDVTHLQQDFLRRYHDAGMCTGIISGIEIGRKLMLACVDLDEADDLGYTLTVEAHRFNGRNQYEIVQMIREFQI